MWCVLNNASARQGFTEAQVESFEVPVPPLREQLRIVAFLDKLQSNVDAIESLQTKTAEELDELSPAVVVNAVSGDL
jgi:type I restriction enzyme S subunit